MSKNFEKEYQNITSSDMPDLWNRISQGISDGLYAEGGEKYLPKEDEAAGSPENISEEAGAAKDSNEALFKTNKPNSRTKKTKTHTFRKWIPYISGAAAAVILLAVFLPRFANFGKSSKSTMDMAEVTMDCFEYEDENGFETEMDTSGGTMDDMMLLFSTEESAAPESAEEKDFVATTPESEVPFDLLTLSEGETIEVTGCLTALTEEEGTESLLATLVSDDNVSYEFSLTPEESVVLVIGDTYRVTLEKENEALKLLGVPEIPE